MKFVCEGINLSDASLTVSKACATKTVNPLMECIKISAKNDGITLSAYDGEISIEKTINAEIIEEGETCVNGRLFTDFVGKISNTVVTIGTGEKGLEILYDDSRSYIQTLDAKDFPFITRSDDLGYFELEEGKLKDVIVKTVFCCASDDSRPILKGCLLETDGEKLYASALDGFRMAVTECEVKGGENAKIVCPARTLTEISRMLDGDDKTIRIGFSKNTLSVQIGDTLLMSRLYIGEFVKKSNIYPPTFETVVCVKKSELIETVERASVLIRGDKNNLIVMEIKADGIKVYANSELGNVAETVKGELSGKELKIAMNSKYILDALKALTSDEVKLSFNTPISPFTVEGKDNAENSYLVLPVRTNA